jgi:hypothetical protein
MKTKTKKELDDELIQQLKDWNDRTARIIRFKTILGTISVILIIPALAFAIRRFI